MERVFEAHGDRLIKLMAVGLWKQIQSAVCCTIHGVCSGNLYWIIRNRRHPVAKHSASPVGITIHSLKAVHFVLPHPTPQIAKLITMNAFRSIAGRVRPFSRNLESY